MQIDNCSPNGARANSGESMSQIYKILPNIEQLVKALRVKNVPILFTKHIEILSQLPSNVRSALDRKRYKYDMFLPHSKGIEFHPVIPDINDIILEKNSWSAFSNPALDMYLKKNKIKEIIITGVDTQCCVLATAIDAFTLGYEVIIPEDCVATKDKNYDEYHISTIKIFDKYFAKVTTSDEIISATNSC